MTSAFVTGLLRVAAVAAVAGGLSGGIYLAVQAGRGSEPAQQAAVEATQSALPTETPFPEATETATAEPAAGATLVPTPPIPPTVAPAAPTTPAPPTPTPVIPGELVVGPSDYRFGRLLLHLPAAGEFILGPGIGDPSGPFFLVYHVPTQSSLWLDPDDGRELERRVVNPTAGPVFDAILASLELVP